VSRRPRVQEALPPPTTDRPLLVIQGCGPSAVVNYERSRGPRPRVGGPSGTTVCGLFFVPRHRVWSRNARGFGRRLAHLRSCAACLASLSPSAPSSGPGTSVEGDPSRASADGGPPPGTEGTGLGGKPRGGAYGPGGAAIPPGAVYCEHYVCRCVRSEELAAAGRIREAILVHQTEVPCRKVSAGQAAVAHGSLLSFEAPCGCPFGLDDVLAGRPCACGRPLPTLSWGVDQAYGDDVSVEVERALLAPSVERLREVLQAREATGVLLGLAAARGIEVTP